MNNLLTHPLIAARPCGALSLPGVLAALARGEIDSFLALRPHQAPAWHMFLVQLAALALHGAGRDDLPEDEETWRDLLRGLTPGFPKDEPWRLVVDDWLKPAFMQPPVAEGVRLPNAVPSPDALDLLITSKNHDIKQAIAVSGDAEDWIFALVSLQTGEGYGGQGNQGAARMNGGSSSRPMLALAPLSEIKDMAPRPGAWFRRDVKILLARREKQLDDHPSFANEGGLGLVWLAPWPEGRQLRLGELDIWFIEVCRRIRLIAQAVGLSAVRGTSKATRIDAKQFNGALGDPYAPVHKAENKSLTLGEGDFDYARLTDLLFSGDWELPLLAQPAPWEKATAHLGLVCAALSRGNSKTDGFKTRIVPLRNQLAQAFGARREEIHGLAKAQIDEIAAFDKALGFALALSAAGGDRERIDKERRAYTYAARAQFDRAADAIFFPHLWRRFEAQDLGEAARKEERRAFQAKLQASAEEIFAAALPTMPCAGIFRPRAQARAENAFKNMVRHDFPLLFETEKPDVPAH